MNHHHRWSLHRHALGIAVVDITEERRTQLRLKNGVQVESVDGVGARAGLRPGDLLLSLNTPDVTSARQFAELVAKLDKSKTRVALVRRGESASFVPLRPLPAPAPAR